MTTARLKARFNVRDVWIPADDSYGICKYQDDKFCTGFDLAEYIQRLERRIAQLTSARDALAQLLDSGPTANT